MSRVIAAFAQFFDGTGQPLENGWLKFTESQSDTLKPTYADANQSIANENPLQLDAEGRCPNCFGQGIYRVVLFENNPVTNVPGAMIQTFDPVTAEYVNTGNGSGNFGDWDIDESYQIGQVVLYGGVYYRSVTANNIGNQPDLNSDQWEVIEFLRYWNADVTYADGDPVFWDSGLYFSLSDGNMGNQPDLTPLYWKSTLAVAVDFTWSAGEVYDTGYIVYYDGVYYRSLIDSNAGNQPDTNLDKWEIIDFLRTWNDSVTYAADDLILYSGKIYTSLLGSNLNNQPDISPTYWQLYTPYVYWYESGTDWTHTGAAYNIGDATHRVAVIHLDAFDAFPTTPSSAPTADYEVANKKYVDDSILQDWEETGTALQPIVSDDQDLGSATNLVSNVFIANDPTADEHAVRLNYLDAMLYETPFINGFDNGDFQVWERFGASPSISLSATVSMTADRCRVNVGDGAATISQGIVTVGEILSGSTTRYALRFNQTTASTTTLYFAQTYLDVTKYAGETITISLDVYSDTDLSIRPFFVQNFGTGGSSQVVTNGSYDSTGTSAWTHLSWQVDIPSISGKTIGTAPDVFTMAIELPLSTTFDAYFTNIQTLPGTHEARFQRLDFNQQLYRCLPYFQKTYDVGTAIAAAVTSGRHIMFFDGVASQTAVAYSEWRFKQMMAATPVCATYDITGNLNSVNIGSSTATPTLIVSRRSLEVYATPPSASTYLGIYYHAIADTGY